MIGNRDNLPNHPVYLEDLGVLPTKARIYKVDDFDGDDEPWNWQLDGYAVIRGIYHAVTSTCWNFPSWDEAVKALPEFEAAVREVTATYA